MPETLVQVNIPDIATKQLKMREASGRRIITVSSNLLTLFDFSKGDLVSEESLGANKGIVVRRLYGASHTGRVKKVYSRTYPRRKNNPLEHMIEVSSQRLIEDSFPEGCTRVHVTFEPGKVTITPLATMAERVMSNAQNADPFSVFAALTSGVDLASMRQQGYKVSAVLEWRPQEARDKSDLTETGAIAAMANSGPIHAVFNEDVTATALDRLGKVMERHPVMVFSASPQCDDHSNLKSKKAKEVAFEDGNSSADMILDLLNIIERLAVPVVVFENVPGMIGSAAYNVACLRLRRWGYTRYEHIGDPRDYGGLTSRKRAYVVFTQLPASFEFEKPSTSRTKDVWKEVQPFLAGCRDVSHSKSLQDGKTVGRLRSIRPDSTSIPTPVKSQYRMAKDSVVVEPEDGRFLFPSEDLLKHMLGINDVDLNAVSETISSEIIGQSIDFPHHAMVMRCIGAHIALWRENLCVKRSS